MSIPMPRDRRCWSSTTVEIAMPGLNRTQYPSLPQGGFTLLELLLVVTILSAVAWMSLGYVNNNGDQVRFEDTKNRLQAIRRAIIGDTSRTLNGQPVISGYVADMGVIPSDINALISRKYCQGDPTKLSEEACLSPSTWREQGQDFCSDATYSTQSLCEANNKVWNFGFGHDDKYGLWLGWNGPYLQATSTMEYTKFLDGWGNNDGSNNFGWIFAIDLTTGDFSVQSVGREGTSTGSDKYDVDYPATGSPPMIAKSQYSKNISTASIQVKLAPPTGYSLITSGLCLILIKPVGGKINLSSLEGEPSKIYSIIDDSSSLPVWDGTTKTITFAGFSGVNPNLFLGGVAYQITDYNGTTCTSAIGGNNGTEDNWRSFYFMPNGTMPVLEWNVP